VSRFLPCASNAACTEPVLLPTTGMDPINRRHVWDVIEAAKQDRCVILTTHSMEEADILGDKIGIMAKGRLRCIGTSVRLKTKFGQGYRVSVSCGDNLKPDDPRSLSVKSLFKDRLGVSVAEESKAYMHFNVSSGSDSDELMSRFFEDIEAQKGKLGIVDVQLAMSSLEDVFLTVATASELEEAKNNNKTTVVTLKSGEPVGVLLGFAGIFPTPPPPREESNLQPCFIAFLMPRHVR
jgi:ABC-type proline/glycine betaine transport system ATPase subunit